MDSFNSLVNSMGCFLEQYFICMVTVKYAGLQREPINNMFNILIRKIGMRSSSVSNPYCDFKMLIRINEVSRSATTVMCSGNGFDSREWQSSRYCWYEPGLFPPTFIIDGNAKFQLEVSEDEDLTSPNPKWFIDSWVHVLRWFTNTDFLGPHFSFNFVGDLW